MPNFAWHVELGIELDTRRHDLGHPEHPDLWQQLIEDRPLPPGTLECVDTHGDCPRWLLPVTGPYRHFRHYNPAELHGYTAKSDEHKAWQQYLHDRAEQRGLPVAVEQRTETGRRVKDVHIGGPVPIACEIQLSYIHPSTIARRGDLDQQDGDTPLWIANNDRSPVINRAPWSRVAKDTPARILAGTADLLYGGVMATVWEDCGRRHPNCPETGRRPCGKKHVFLEPARGIHLDELVLGATTAEFKPTRRRDGNSVRYIWLPAADHERYHDDQAGQKKDEEPDVLPNSDMVNEDRSCRYGEEGDHKNPAEPRDTGASLYVANATPPSETGRHTLIQAFTPPARKPGLDWSRNKVGDPQPCYACGKPAMMRAPDGRPLHKVCAERALPDGERQ